MKKEFKHLRVWKETHKRIKILASKEGKSIAEILDDFSSGKPRKINFNVGGGLKHFRR